MTETTETTEQAMKLQVILPDGQQIQDNSNVLSSQQASESTVVLIEQVDDEGNSCCLR